MRSGYKTPPTFRIQLFVPGGAEFLGVDCLELGEPGIYGHRGIEKTVGVVESTQHDETADGVTTGGCFCIRALDSFGQCG